tara:strand:- start:610 stop:1380 length:771 start_codon:yes stop_codon:yes gene_type:complete
VKNKLSINDYNFLKENGYLVLNNFFENNFFVDLLDYCENILKICKDNNEIGFKNIRNMKKNDTYDTMSISNECIFVDRRKNSIDNGMIDIFNPEHCENIRKKDENPISLFKEIINTKIVSQINKFEQKKLFSLKNTNIYEHIKTSKPRVAHFDNLKTYYKVFLFLSDVKTSHGSFYYYPGSQKNKFRNKLMSFINHKIFQKKNGSDTDINFLYSFNSNKRDLIGTKGTIVISDVSGLHGSNPVVNIQRKVLVQCIR